jgi:hypothetical protein
MLVEVTEPGGAEAATKSNPAFKLSVPARTPPWSPEEMPAGWVQLNMTEHLECSQMHRADFEAIMIVDFLLPLFIVGL